MRRRLRPALDASAYQVVRDNRAWNDHILRTLCTAAAIAWLEPKTIVDPACGDGSIVLAAARLWPLDGVVLADISSPQIEDLRQRFPFPFIAKVTTHCEDANETLRQSASIALADVVVMTEILEHVEVPEALLQEARKAGRFLVASSPLNEFEATGNHEHVWGWDRDGYREMLESTGWVPIAYQELSFFPPFYTFQLWVCK